MLRFAAALLVLAPLLASACTAPRGPTQRVEDFLGGPASVGLITGPERTRPIEAWRIDGMAFMEGRAEGAKETIRGYPVLAGPVTVDDASAATLADVLTSDDTYLWDIAKACEFLPGVAFRYSGGDRTVEVLVCFSCDELEVWCDGKKTGHEDFDPRRGDLVRIAQRLFPDDEKIRALDR